jgi:predicted PurR-regulated permease PerM
MMIEQKPLAAQIQSDTAIWPDWQKQIVAVLLLLLIPIVLYFLRPVLAPLLLTFALAFVLMYPIRWLQRLKLSYRASALIVYFIFLIVSLVAVIWFVVYAVGAMIDTLQRSRCRGGWPPQP